MQAASLKGTGTTEANVREAMQALDPLGDELFPAEQKRMVNLLVERVDIGEEGLAARIRVDGLSGLTREMRDQNLEDAA